jgi:YVTN family beta-propeller protein
MLRKLVILIAISTIACGGGGNRPAVPGGSMPTTRVPGADNSQLVLYARLMHPVDPGVRWEIRKISLQKPDGSQLEVARSTRVLDTDMLATGEKLVLVADLPSGEYTGITLFTEGAYLKPGDRPMSIEASTVAVDHPFSVLSGNSKTLTLVLSIPSTAGQAEPFFRPVIEVEEEIPRPTARLVYVSNEKSANVSVIEKDIKRVVYNAYIGARPSAIGADNRRGRLYIAARSSGTIYEMDMMSNHVINVAELDFVDEPVYVLPVPEKDLIIVVNYGTDTVHLLDSFNLQPVSTIDVGRRPTKAIYSTTWEMAFIINSQYGTLSVLNLETTPSAPDTTLQVELRPSGMAINQADDWLYVSNEGSTDITVIKMETLAVERSLTVGTGITDIAYDPFGRRLYVAFGFSNEVKCIDPYSGVDVFRIAVPGQPRQLVFDPDEKKLYVLLPEEGSVGIIDPGARALERVIETGIKPSGIALKQ